MCRHTGSTFHQVPGPPVPVSHTAVPCLAFLGSGRLILLQYNAAHSDIPSLRMVRKQVQRLGHDVVPQLHSR
jgi:hypothetical protein